MHLERGVARHNDLVGHRTFDRGLLKVGARSRMRVGVKVWARYGEDRMTNAKPNLSRLSALATGLGLHQHQCLIYNTREEQFAAALPFLKAGLERWERCLYIA